MPCRDSGKQRMDIEGNTLAWFIIYGNFVPASRRK